MTILKAKIDFDNANKAYQERKNKPVTDTQWSILVKAIQHAAHNLLLLQEAEIVRLREQVAQTSTHVEASSEIWVTVESLSSEELQSRRDEVRSMMANEQPSKNIPIYQWSRIHGAAISFLRENYWKYIIKGNEVLFARDLASIDDRLLRAIRNETRGELLSPIGTESNLSQALVAGRFSDGKNTKQRIYNANHRTRWKIQN
jgi:hypothetical protein